ncbi:ATP-binding protein [Nocardioides ungokensis]|uniref:sensor histidine kinase n=1 Tax=Nocardioides ungokensis TaxID=1643322 RepID=UPI003CCCE3A8
MRDHGRGIPADKLESVFERFEQVDSSDARQKGGTGLGLAISRGIVERHGGRIWAESELGAGTTILFTLPSSPAPRTMATSDGARTLPGSILLIGGDGDLARAITKLLTDEGLDVVHTTTAAEAVARGRELRPRAVVLDLQGLDDGARVVGRPATRARPGRRDPAGLQRRRRRTRAPCGPRTGPHGLPDQGPRRPRGAPRETGGPPRRHHRKT